MDDSYHNEACHYQKDNGKINHKAHYHQTDDNEYTTSIITITKRIKIKSITKFIITKRVIVNSPTSKITITKRIKIISTITNTTITKRMMVRYNNQNHHHQRVIVRPTI